MNFFNRLAAALIGTTMAIVQFQPVIAQNLTEINRIAQEITVKVIQTGSASNGSGVIFEKQGNIYSVVTNRHVVDAEGSYEILTPKDGQKHQVTSVQKLPGLDLAIVKFESSTNYEVAKIGDSNNVSHLQTVYVAGFPGTSTDIEIISGEIRSISEDVLEKPESKEGYALSYTNQTLPGSSGGSVLDENGNLIAINGEAEREVQSGRDISRGIPINIFLAATNIDNSEISVTSTDSEPIEIPSDRKNSIIEILNKVPVFVIADEKGALLVGSVKDDENETKQIAQVFFSHKKAEETFSDLRSENPELAKKVRIFVISLGEAYQVQNKPENENKINIVYVPSDEAVTSAKPILEARGEEYRKGVPLFFATVGEKKLSLKDDKGDFPFFFDKQQLEEELLEFKQEKPDLANEIRIDVVPLEGIIKDLANNNNNNEIFNNLKLIPSTESVEFIREKLPQAERNRFEENDGIEIFEENDGIEIPNSLKKVKY